MWEGTYREGRGGGRDLSKGALGINDWKKYGKGKEKKITSREREENAAKNRLSGWKGGRFLQTSPKTARDEKLELRERKTPSGSNTQIKNGTAGLPSRKWGLK